MTRHVIAGHFGPSDTAAIASAGDEALTHLGLLTSHQTLGCGVGRAIGDMATMGLFPTESGVDLLVLAAHVHVADTRVSRSSDSQDSWTRELRLVVPVSDPDRWEGASSTLKVMLDFLTGDVWTIGFRPRPAAFANTVRSGQLHVSARPDVLSLFSGGLDSLVGAIDLLGLGQTPLLVSHASDGATSDAQQRCYELLQRAYPDTAMQRLRMWSDYSHAHFPGTGRERTSRGRSFMFIALGVFAGTALRAPVALRVPENGLMALNIPLDPLRVGSHSTRTTHPFYMARWNELLTQLGLLVTVENPYWNKTKGELVSECVSPALIRQTIPLSMSCSSPSKGRWNRRGLQHCGYCLPCIVRRAAVEAALGVAGDPTSYGDRLHGQVLSTRRAVGEQARSCQFAISRLHAQPRLPRVVIHSVGPLSDESASRQHELADVYRRGMEEIARLLGDVQTTSQ